MWTLYAIFLFFFLFLFFLFYTTSWLFNWKAAKFKLWHYLTVKLISIYQSKAQIYSSLNLSNNAQSQIILPFQLITPKRLWFSQILAILMPHSWSLRLHSSHLLLKAVLLSLHRGSRLRPDRTVDSLEPVLLKDSPQINLCPDVHCKMVGQSCI